MKFQSAIITAASGSVAGSTYSRNRFGMYIRPRSIPVNPNSTRQQAIRGIFTSLINRWRNTLTAAQRLAWDNYGKATPYSDVFGTPIILTGQTEYVRTNSLFLQSGGSVQDTAPTIFDRGEALDSLIAFGIDAVVANQLDVTASFASPASAAGVAMLYLSTPINVSRNFWRGPYQFAGNTTFAAAATQVVFTLDQTDPLEYFASTPVVNGQTRGLQIRLYYNDGRVPARWRDIATAAAV